MEREGRKACIRGCVRRSAGPTLSVFTNYFPGLPGATFVVYAALLTLELQKERPGQTDRQTDYHIVSYLVSSLRSDKRRKKQKSFRPVFSGGIFLISTARLLK